MAAAETAASRAQRRDPLAVHWIGCDLTRIRAWTAVTVLVRLENAGSASWHSLPDGGLRLSYHWLDTHGNPVVWDAPRTAFAQPVGPGAAAAVPVSVKAPVPPGRYLLAFDLVEEHRFWLSEIGVPFLTVPVKVEPRVTRRRLGVCIHPGPGDRRATEDALAAQEEPLTDDAAEAVAHLVEGAVPPPDWSTRLLDAHAEGFGAVSCSIAAERGFRHLRALEEWAPTGSRNPRFPGPLLLPSLVAGLEPVDDQGWPAFEPDRTLPWDTAESCLFDGRVVVTLRPRSGRPRG